MATMTGNQVTARRRQTGMRSSLLLLLAAVAVLVAGCGNDDAGVRSEGAVPSTDRQEEAPIYRGAGTVIESPEHGPQFCGMVYTSLPPQCAGVSLVGWDWDAVDGEKSTGGTTWGDWEVTGTFDGEALTLTEAPSTPSEESREEPSDLSSPCPTPEGGWAPVDPTKVSVESQDAALRIADQLPDVAGTWLDHSINPALADGFDPGDEEVANDPNLLVINVQVTDDTARAESAIREVWGGALCVTTAERTMAELRATQDELTDLYGPGPGGLSSGGIDVPSNQVRVTAYVATPELTGELESRFGDAVAVTGLLEPVT